MRGLVRAGTGVVALGSLVGELGGGVVQRRCRVGRVEQLRAGARAGQLGPDQVEGGGESLVDFLLGIVPTTVFSAFTEGDVLQVLFIALLVGFAVQALGDTGKPILRYVELPGRTESFLP